MFEEYRISGTADHLHIDGAVRQSAKLNADGFFKALLSLPPPRCLDLLRISAGIFAVDRISKRRRQGNNEHGIRQLHLTFDVRDVDFWTQPDIRNLLLEILKFLTDDDWAFDFKLAQQTLGDSGHQEFLDLPKDFHPAHGALYSGGLDSAAGLANRLIEGANDFMLVTVGHQSGLHRRIEKQFNTLKGVLASSKIVSPRLLHSTLTTSLEGGKAKRMKEQERTQRSRAFLFCSAATIAGKAYGLKTIEMFENGVGAINLPLMTGMLSSGLSTRGAHPTFLRLMSELATLVAECQIQFVLPFLTKTKGEMLQALKLTDGVATWAQDSRSCVHTSIREHGKTHCGRCPACIERRQAFLSAGFDENLDVYQTNVLTDSVVDEDEASYLRLYQLEAKKWVEGAEIVRRRMLNHLCLTDVPTDEHERVMELQVRNSREVLRTLGGAFTHHIKPIARSTSQNDSMKNGGLP